MMASPMKPPAPTSATSGVACVTARDFRWERGDIKSVSLLGNVLARQMSADHGARRDDHVPRRLADRGLGSNVWVVHEGAVLGPPQSEHVLEGIRYELLRELCEEEGIAYNLRPIAEADVLSRRRADAQLGHQGSAAGDASSTASWSGHGALRGKPGPIYARLYEAYQRAKAVAVDLTVATATRCRMPDQTIPPEQSLIEYPCAVPDQGDGRAASTASPRP